MRRKADKRENFFVAKKRDSESATRELGWLSRPATTSFMCRSLLARITKTAAI